MIYGVDIGGTKIELAIFDAQYRQQTAWREATPKHDYQEFLQRIVNMVGEADQKTGVPGSIGIGLPCVFDDQGYALAAGIPCINGRPVLSDISEALSRPVSFQNDVKAFVFSEANGGAAEGHRHVLGVVLGTGVGGGLCVGGKIHQSRQNVACEYGHVPLSAKLQNRYNLPLWPCGCGLKGCFNEYISGPGLQRMCGHFGGHYKNAQDLMVGVRAGDTKANEIFNAYIDCLGAFVSMLTLMYDPDMIVLGGGLSNIDEIYQRLPDAAAEYQISGVIPPPVVPPMYGDSSGVRGVAMLGYQAVLEANADE